MPEVASQYPTEHSSQLSVEQEVFLLNLHNLCKTKTEDTFKNCGSLPGMLLEMDLERNYSQAVISCFQILRCLCLGVLSGSTS